MVKKSIIHIKKISPARESALSLFLIVLFIILNIPLNTSWLTVNDDDDSDSFIHQLNLISDPQKYAQRLNAWRDVLIETPRRIKNAITFLHTVYNPLSKSADYNDLISTIKPRGPPWITDFLG